METESVVIPASVPGPMSVVTTIIRVDFAQAVAKVVGYVAAERQAPREIALEIQAKVIQKLFHWMCRKGTHFLDTAETMGRLERMAGRLIDRALRHRAKERLRHGVGVLEDVETRRILRESPHPRGPINVGIFEKLWMQLTFEEQRVLQLVEFKYSLADIALILDVTVNAVEFYLSQANQKIHRAYVVLC